MTEDELFFECPICGKEIKSSDFPNRNSFEYECAEHIKSCEKNNVGVRK